MPGQDTELRTELPQEYLVFEDTPVNARVRAAWLLRRRLRPRCPTFGHCPIPRYKQDCSENTSKLCLVYFRAWTGLPTQADEDVPHVADLLGSHASWEAAFREWLRALPCRETQKHISNFLSVYRVRGAAADAENSDNDDADTTGTYICGCDDFSNVADADHGCRNQERAGRGIHRCGTDVAAKQRRHNEGECRNSSFPTKSRAHRRRRDLARSATKGRSAARTKRQAPARSSNASAQNYGDDPSS